MSSCILLRAQRKVAIFYGRLKFTACFIFELGESHEVFYIHARNLKPEIRAAQTNATSVYGGTMPYFLGPAHEELNTLPEKH